MREENEDGGGSKKDVEVAPALISVDPSHQSVAVAVGSDLRIFHLSEGCGIALVDKSTQPFHQDSIRAIRYASNANLFVSAGDDKIVKIWSTLSWRCISSVCAEKRVSAVAISNDALYVCFADKFGVVWVVDLHGLDANASSIVNKTAAPLLSHYCSIITSLEFSPDGRFIISADRDFKIRVSVFPNNPLDGAHEIQSFCLGHTQFVSCLAFICSMDYPLGFLVSGSGDSTVRLWEITSGFLLDTFEIDSRAGNLELSGSEEGCSSVADICTISNSNLVAVAIQSLQGIMLLRCDFSSQTLHFAKVVSVMGETFVPTSLACGFSAEFLWMITGVSKLDGSDYNSLTRVRVLSGLKRWNADSAKDELVVLEDDEVPGSKKLLEKLQGSLSIEEKVFSAAAEAVKKAMCNLLIKKQYPSENREFRKRTRNDKKIKQ